MPKLRNGSKGDSNPGSLHCESAILPLSYRALGIKAKIPLSNYQKHNISYDRTCNLYSDHVTSTSNDVFHDPDYSNPYKHDVT